MFPGQNRRLDSTAVGALENKCDGPQFILKKLDVLAAVTGTEQVVKILSPAVHGPVFYTGALVVD